MDVTFKTKNLKQVEAAQYWIDDTTEELLYGGGKSGGKSYLGASLIFGDALIYPGTHYFIARKALNDLRKFTIPTIHEVFTNWGLDIKTYLNFNGQDNTFHLPNESKVFFIACDDIPSDPLFERFGSMQNTRGWIEEGGEVPEAAKANLALSIGRWRNKEYGLKDKLLITANPKKGWMKRDFIDPWNLDALPPSRRFVQALPTDNPYNTQNYVDKLSNERDQVRRQRLFLGDWDYDEDKDSLVSFDALSDSFSNNIVKDNNKYLTVDVARFGDDSTVFAFWEGLELYKVEKRQKQSLDVTRQNVRDYAAAERIPWSHVLIDEDGIGGGVVDGLPGVKGFIANSTALPTVTEIRSKMSKVQGQLTPRTNYKNLKAQCAYKIAELINEHKVAFKVQDYREEIIEDLTALLRSKNADKDGKLELRAKSDVKTDIGRSPDIGDPIIFRAWFEVSHDAKTEDTTGTVISVQLANKFAQNRSRISQNDTQ